MQKFRIKSAFWVTVISHILVSRLYWASTSQVVLPILTSTAVVLRYISFVGYICYDNVIVFWRPFAQEMRVVHMQALQLATSWNYTE